MDHRRSLLKREGAIRRVVPCRLIGSQRNQVSPVEIRRCPRGRCARASTAAGLAQSTIVIRHHHRCYRRRRGLKMQNVVVLPEVMSWGTSHGGAIMRRAGRSRNTSSGTQVSVARRSCFRRGTSSCVSTRWRHAVALCGVKLCTKQRREAICDESTRRRE